jgi:hypothetical protein
MYDSTTRLLRLLKKGRQVQYLAPIDWACTPEAEAVPLVVFQSAQEQWATSKVAA